MAEGAVAVAAPSQPCARTQAMGEDGEATKRETMSRYRIDRDDGQQDEIAGTSFASYDEAHAVLERYYSDLCCSDEREYYRIVAETTEVTEPTETQ
jgi:hypothetical protein